MKMSRFFIAALLILSSVCMPLLQAQSSYKMGVIFGGNYSSLRSDLFTTASGRLTATLGASVLLGFENRFELISEINFAQKGASVKTAVFNPENRPFIRNYALYHNSFEAGVFAGYQPLESLPLRLQAGGYFGGLFHTLNRSDKNMYVGNYENIVDATQVTLLNESMSGIDFGPAFGVSGGEGRFRVNVRYYLGLRNLYDNIAFTTENHRIKSNSIRVAITYFFKDRSEWY